MLNTEASLHVLSDTDVGWSGDLAVLPPDVEAYILLRLGSRVPASKVQHFLIFVRRIFAATVEREARVLSQRRHLVASPLLETLAYRRHRPQPGKKLATVLRTEVLGLLELFQWVRARSNSRTRWHLCKALSLAHPLIAGFLELRFCEEYPSRAGQPFAAAQLVDSDPEVLGALLQELHDQIDNIVKPGASEPALEQMVRGLAALYLDCSGSMPGRSNILHDGEMVEGGPFIDTCRYLAEAVNDALPVDLRRSIPCDMTKIARKVIEELKEEQQQKASAA